MKIKPSRLFAVSALLLSPLLFKPRDKGLPYTLYFERLNRELRKHGLGRPVLVIDLDRVDKNLVHIQESFRKSNRTPKTLRLVVKSLPSPSLLGYLMEKVGTSSLMVFHQPFLNAVAEAFPHSDVLIGKPLPVAAARIFYEKLVESGFDPQVQVQWLIDSPQRLREYQGLALELGQKMRIGIEIDVGDHRGHVGNLDTLERLLSIIQDDPSHLELAGFLGYDAHLIASPRALRENLFKEVIERYRSFVTFARERFPTLWDDQLTFNGAGSRTFRLYEGGDLLNDLSLGSCLVKPTDFDTDLLQDFEPALFIATPVLKRRPRLDIPILECLGPLMSWWNPNRAQTFFIYGGYWKARFESPGGLSSNPLYGHSSNSEMVNASRRVEISVDDYIFLRPTQSEAVMLQFGDLVITRSGQIVDRWSVFSQDG